MAIEEVLATLDGTGHLVPVENSAHARPATPVRAWSIENKFGEEHTTRIPLDLHDGQESASN